MKTTEEGLLDSGDNSIIGASLDLSCSFKERLAFLFTGHVPQRIKVAITQTTNDAYDLGAHDYHSEYLAIRRERYHKKVAAARESKIADVIEINPGLFLPGVPVSSEVTKEGPIDFLEGGHDKVGSLNQTS